MILDTCVLIDLQRERRRSEFGPAHRWARQHAGQPSRISAVAWGEFAEAFSEGDPVLPIWRAAFEILPIDERVAESYALVVRELRGKGQLIGVNDIWIAATALAYEAPLVSRNGAEFTRIPGLTVWTY